MSPEDRRLCHAAPRPARGFTSRWTTVAGLRLHVRARPGTGPAWVLLHGLAVSHRYLMPTAAQLADRPVYVPDLPGFGLSGKPREVFDTGQHADTVAAWMDTDGISGAHLLANSYGCQVAAELAVRRPDLVASLVLVGPTVDPAAPTAAGQARRWVTDVLGEDLHQARIIAEDVLEAGPGRVLATLRHSVRHHIEQRIPLVTAPVLILRGQFDPIAPPRWAARLAALAVDGRTGEVSGAAHNAITTAGPEVAARALAFAAALPGPATGPPRLG
jgi:pimeloyl-ACP methyl ester carboxylesterase